MKLEVIARKSTSEKERVPLLFVHGSCHAAWCWEENFLDYFARHGYDSYAVSLRGHGASDGGDKLRWASVSEYVEDVAQIARRMSKPPIVIGHSLGGLVTQKYLEKYAAAGGVLLASSPISGMFFTGLPLAMRHPLLFAKVFLARDVHALYATPELARKFLFSDDMDQALIEKYAGKLGKESFRAALDMMFDLPNAKRIKVPMLVLGAETDVIVNVSAIQRTACAYRSTMKIFPGMAHDMMLEDGWQSVAEFILQWLNTNNL